MEETITFRPILWRLVLWKFFPFYVGYTATTWIISTIKHYPSFPLVELTIAIFIMSIIFSTIMRKKFDIVISKNIISGPGTVTWNSQSFPIADLDISELYKKQSFYEKISGIHTLNSINSKKIMVADFIYGKTAVKELYGTLENYYSQSVK